MQTDKATSGILLAGVAKADITNYDSGPANDPLYAKALAIGDGTVTAIIITVDAVSIGEIGSIRNDFLANVRTRLHESLGIDPMGIVVNASHCHGSVCPDVEDRTIQAVTQAYQNMVPVRVGSGTGHEDRISENRRFKLADGTTADARRAYSLPADDQIAGVGPIDPEIGILRLDREDGRRLAVVYNFACHPIMGVPNGGNTADITGFTSKVIEENQADDTLAMFIQGCAGDINPKRYKDVENPPDAEPLGNLLGLSVLQALKGIESRDSASLKIIREEIDLPREDLAPHIERLQKEQTRLLQSLRPTDINFKTFLNLSLKRAVSPDFPSFYSHRYLHDRAAGRGDLDRLDARNQESADRYLANLHTMEKLTRLHANLRLLEMHHAQNVAAGSDTLQVEMVGLRIGDFVLITFPGELSVEIGLGIKQRSPHPLTFVAGITNGYIYYSPTAEQLQNRGGAQEDSDCHLAAEWQALFEAKAADMLARV